MLYLDVTRLVHRLSKGLLPTGVDRVGLAYVRHYSQQARAVLCYKGWFGVLAEADSIRLFNQLLSSSHLSGKQVRRFIASAIAGRFKRKLEPGVLLHTSHSGTEFARFYTELAKYGIGVVAMIHDLIPLTHPEYCRPDVLSMQVQRLRIALPKLKGIIANSADTANAIAVAIADLKISRPPMATALLAPGTAVCFPGERPLHEPYFVILSTIEPRKNHWLLLHIWRDLIERFGDGAPALVVIGRRGWECENVVDMLERCASLRGKVIEESDCSDERLHLYLQHAQALLFPSFVEGYGMPLVEALQLGVPAIASDLPVFHEIAGEIPDYIHPLDGMRWIDHIMAYAEPSNQLREAQLQRLQAYRAPSWEQHFAVVDDFLESLRAV